MSKKNFGLVIVAMVAFVTFGFVFLYRAAQNSRKRSDLIMQQFNEADKAIAESKRIYDSLRAIADTNKYK